MARRFTAVLPLLLSGLACDNGSPPPPSPTQPAKAELSQDFAHFATVRGDQQITIPNLQFVVQHDPRGSGLAGFTLWSSRPGPDGSRLVFGWEQDLSSLDRLTSREVHLAGGRFLDPSGSGVFTSAVVARPKFATLKIAKVEANEVTGTITGEFYRFRALQPAVRPDVVNLEIAFKATLVAR
jgi:hypothetical protein